MCLLFDWVSSHKRLKTNSVISFGQLERRGFAALRSNSDQNLCEALGAASTWHQAVNWQVKARFLTQHCAKPLEEQDIATYVPTVVCLFIKSFKEYRTMPIAWNCFEPFSGLSKDACDILKSSNLGILINLTDDPWLVLSKAVESVRYDRVSQRVSGVSAFPVSLHPSRCTCEDFGQRVFVKLTTRRQKLLLLPWCISSIPSASQDPLGLQPWRD